MAGIAINVSDTSLPRQQKTAQLTIRFAVDDILPSDVEIKDGEENIWKRLWITLPDSEAKNRDLPLSYHESAVEVEAPDPTEEEDDTTEAVHPTYYYVGISREVEEEPNDNGNVTVYYELAIRAYEEGDLNALYDADGKINVRFAYRLWEVDAYGGALASITHSFARIDGVPSVAPRLEGLTALHHRLQVAMQREAEVEFTNSQGKQAVQGVIAYVLEKSETPVSLAPLAKLFKPVADGGDTEMPAGAECMWLPDCSISCPPNVYLSYDKVSEIPALSHSTLLSGSSRSIPDLKPNVVYQVMLQYYPDGVARSACMEAEAIENKTLLELNGFGVAKRHDLHCFVATAAYGSEAGIVEQLRWFRDKFLLPYASGRKLVSLYYEYSPSLAALISYNALLKMLAQALLLLPFALVLLLKYPLVPAALLLIGLLYYALHKRRRRALV